MDLTEWTQQAWVERIKAATLNYQDAIKNAVASAPPGAVDESDVFVLDAVERALEAARCYFSGLAPSPQAG